MTSHEIWVLGQKRAAEIIENIITPGFQPTEIPILKWKTEADYKLVYDSPEMTYSDCNDVNSQITRELEMHGHKPIELEATYDDYSMWLIKIDRENTAEARAAYVSVLFKRSKR